jgi:nitroimidazol reductase NimA-like FMN-containing flavoprotein (pyridoxamine 5'-phosphate oxidase superfamily)
MSAAGDVPVLDDLPNVEILSDEECMRLLAREPVGRLAMTARALPVVLPVNYTLVGRTIVFASGPGLKLDAAHAGMVVCLEVDGLDRITHGGWSVLATGRLSEISDPERLAEARQLPLSPWALPNPQHYVELPIELLSGRRIRRP